MARSKYPGIQILYEVGTRSELAESYGVSERTLYRWLNKARAETHERQEYPGAKRLEKFKGTRKELAQKYNISERTAYRWLAKARAEGANIPSRQATSKYPGQAILDERGTNKSIGDRYGVSEATIRRWKRQAALEQAAAPTEDIFTEEQEDIFGDSTAEEPKFEDFTEETAEEPTEDEYIDEESRKLLHELLLDNERLVEDSIYLTFDSTKQLQYLQSYIAYQSGLNPYRFYNKEIHDFDYSPEFVSTINIWGDEFETYVKRMEELTDFENGLDIDWVDDL